MRRAHDGGRRSDWERMTRGLGYVCLVRVAVLSSMFTSTQAQLGTHER